MKIVALFVLVAIMCFLISQSETKQQPAPNQAPTQTKKDSAQSRIQIVKPFRKVESF